VTDQQDFKKAWFSKLSKGLKEMDSVLDADSQKTVLTGCACKYPKAGLVKMRDAYAASGDIDQVHRILQATFPVSYCYCGAGFYKGI